MVCQCRFTNFNKCLTVERRIDSGEAMYVYVGREYGESLYFLPSFVVNLKLI